MKHLLIILLFLPLLSIGQTLGLNNNTVTIDGNGIIQYMQPIVQVHRVEDVASPNTDWNKVKWDTLIVNETTMYLGFNADSTGIVYSGTGNAALRVQGCFHTIWNGANNTTASMLGRTLINTTEARCLQVSRTRNRQTNDDDVVGFAGTVYVTQNDTIYVQYKVSNTDFDFEGMSGFDNPVAISVNIEYISKK